MSPLHISALPPAQKLLTIIKEAKKIILEIFQVGVTNTLRMEKTAGGASLVITHSGVMDLRRILL